MRLNEKIISFDLLSEWRAGLTAAQRPLVVTNGCFDILHAGHVTYLHEARALGASLLVGVNDDASVRILKGQNRPVNSENDRSIVLAALEAVTAVCVFPGPCAVEFLTRAIPHVYVKGGDYTVQTLNSEERAAVEAVDGKIVILPFLPGRSTTEVLEKLR